MSDRLLDNNLNDTGVLVSSFLPDTTQRKVVTPTLGNNFSVQEVGDTARVGRLTIFASLTQRDIITIINNETQTFFVEWEGVAYTCISIDDNPSLVWRMFNRGFIDNRRYQTTFSVSITAEV